MVSNEIKKSVDQVLDGIESSNKVERKRALEKLLELLNGIEAFPSNANSSKEASAEDNASSFVEFNELWDTKISRPVYRCLDDPGERCREIAAEIVLTVINNAPTVNTIHLSQIFSVLRHRLGNCTGEHSLEPSEEVRLQYLKIMVAILEKENLEDKNEKSRLFPYMEDAIAVLKMTLSDSFGEIKILSCQAIGNASNAFKKDFHLVASTLIPPILKCLSHQQKKTRFNAIKAIGIVLLSSSSDDFQLVASHLAQRLFDHVPQVRLQASLTAGELLMSWKYAAANCVYLLPLLLTTLEDEVKENRDEALFLWKKVGKQWIESELQFDSRMKDRVDFFENTPLEKCPNNFIRHDLGCRQYISRVVSKLIPALKNDIRDWLVETRIKAACLSYVLISHLEETAVITQHAEQFLSLMQAGVMDSEVKVVKNMCRVANVYGRFIPPKTWCPLVKQRVMSQPNTCNLLILGSILHGSDPDTFSRDFLIEMASIVQDDSVCLIVDDEYLEELLECCKQLMYLGGANVTDIQSQLFKTLISILALTRKQELKVKCTTLIDELATSLNITKLELFRFELHSALTLMYEECGMWGSSSRRVEVFSTLLQEASSAIGYYTDLVNNIFLKVLAPKQNNMNNPTATAEPELQLKMFIILSKQLYSYQETLNSDNKFSCHVLRVVTDIIMPALVWRSGRKASAIRTAATSSLWSIFQSKCLTPDMMTDQNTETYSNLLATIIGLLEDDAEKTRIITCQILENLLTQFGAFIIPQVLIKILSSMTKRLEDTSNDVRITCLKALSSSVFCLESNGQPTLDEGKVEELYSNILIHMDDANETIRINALETLTILGKVYPTRLLHLSEKCEENHKHKEQCNELINRLKSTHCIKS